MSNLSDIERSVRNIALTQEIGALEAVITRYINASVPAPVRLQQRRLEIENQLWPKDGR